MKVILLKSGFFSTFISVNSGQYFLLLIKYKLFGYERLS